MNFLAKSRIQSAASPKDVTELVQSLRPKPCGHSLVRIGNNGDGGYLLPDDLNGIGAVISPGVSDEVSFDLELANRGIDVFMADGSIAEPPINHHKFHFTNKHLGVLDGEYTLTLDSLRAQASKNVDCILQMDIENAEYPVLLSASTETINQFRIMVIEFHRFDDMFGRFQFEIMRAVFSKLLAKHDVVHIHPNNCCPVKSKFGITIPRVMEMTFLRRDRFRRGGNDILKFPHPLDRDNVPGKPSLPLPECWHPVAS